MKPTRILLTIITLGAASCSTTKAIINRAQGGPIEKHGVAGTVDSEPSFMHYGLVPFGMAMDALMSPFRVAEWINED